MAYRAEGRWRGWEPGRGDREWYGSGREGRNDWEGSWDRERVGRRGAGDPEYERYSTREGYRPGEASPRDDDRLFRGGREDYPRPYSAGGMANWYGAGSYDFPEFGAAREREARNYAGRGPKGYQRSDERIREDVNDRLTWSADVDASDIEVRVSGGEVTLAGVVEDRRAKRLAENLAEDVFGVRDIHNQLKVRHGFLAALTGEKADEREVAIPSNPERSETTRREGRPGRPGRDESRR